MGFGDVLDAAFSLFRKSYAAIVLIMAITNIPIAIVQFAVLQSSENQLSSAFGSILSGHGFTGTISSINPLWTVLIDVISLYGATALLVLMNQVYRGKSANVGAAFLHAGRRFLVAIALAVIVSLAVGIGLFIVLIPGLMAAVYFSQTLFLGVIDNDGVFKSIGRSVRLVRGFFWRIVGIAIVAYLIYYVVLAIISGILGGILAGVFHSGLGSPAYATSASVVLLVLQTLMGAFPWTALYVQFMDLKVRKEGLDLNDAATSAEA